MSRPCSCEGVSRSAGWTHDQHTGHRPPATGLTDLVRASLGDPLAEIAEARVEPVHHGSGSLSTASLHRMRGTTTSGVSWSFFVKSIHAIKHSAWFARMPEGLRAEALAQFPWRAKRLPHTLVHGDAGPMNLLVPADGSAQFVAVDWSWPHPAAVGFDLGRLLVGRAHTGELDPADLPAVTR
ncbi:hypothetical protein AB0L53_52390 [Nonomuraea sp. NPDC052129]|uniref:hypothetical protein n=1 Tax=Nonomuraea sp. NPDC052129 TaxID=3154651 RepID=UPI0034304D3B